jgi:glycosyltransferase involved in cell wall biosynthesis
MRVLHICESLQGGAGKAVYRLHEALLRNGVESRVLTRNAGGNVLEVYTYTQQEPLKKQLIKKVKEKTGLGRSLTDMYEERWMKLKPGSVTETFTFPVTEYRIEDHPLTGWAEIIHLHWVSKFLNWPSFFKKINKPIAWTIHDTNTLNGGFHYLLEQELDENKNILAFNKELLELKKNSIANFANKMIFIAPSNWMLSNLKHSHFNAKKAVQIFYTIQPGIYKNRDRQKHREIFGIPENKKCILIMLDERSWKGIDMLAQFFSHYENKEACLVVLRSHHSLHFKTKLDIIYVESIGNELLLALLYNSVDLFVTASVEDNLPNTVIESICCGTPVAAFPIGGMTDLVEPGQNGYLAESVNAESLGKAIDKAISKTWDHNAIMHAAHRKFDGDKIAAQHIEIYKELLQ